jgi:hypothetical protein
LYVELPLIKTSTPEARLQALKDSRELLTSTPGETKGAIFGGGSVETVYAPDTAEMIRMAEYITTGHDYRDTHPEGKRRPVIKQVTNVTVMAPQGVDTDELEHFLQHVENGDFTDFLREMKDQQDRGHGNAEDEDPRADADTK